MGDMADWHLEQMSLKVCEWCGELNGEHDSDCEWLVEEVFEKDQL